MEAKDPYDEASNSIVSGTLRRGIYPELALSSSKGKVEGRLRVTYFRNKAVIQRRKIQIE